MPCKSQRPDEIHILTGMLIWLQVAAFHGVAAGAKTKQVCCSAKACYAEPFGKLWLYHVSMVDIYRVPDTCFCNFQVLLERMKGLRLLSPMVTEGPSAQVSRFTSS